MKPPVQHSNEKPGLQQMIVAVQSRVEHLQGTHKLAKAHSATAATLEFIDTELGVFTALAAFLLMIHDHADAVKSAIGKSKNQQKSRGRKR